MRYREIVAETLGETSDSSNVTQIFINMNTGTVLPAPDADRDGRKWAADHPDDLGIEPVNRYERYNMDHWKLLDRRLSSAGWCFFLGFYHPSYGYYASIDPVLTRDIPAVLTIALDHGASTPDLLNATTTDAGIMQLNRQQVDQLLKEGVGDDLLSDQLASNQKINAILHALTALPFADRITVFGSVARGKPFPGDLDVWIDLRGVPDADYRPLIQLAKANYGKFDPFVVTDDGVICRNDTATGWIAASSVGAIQKQVKVDGKPLSIIPPLKSGKVA